MPIRWITFVLCVTLLAFPIAAQSPNGTISGLVLDPSGKVITGADITIVNDLTRVQYGAKTNGEGIYVVSNLPPGQYRLQVSKTGFKTLIKPDIILNVLGALAINFTLPIGAASETVTVEGGAPIVDTQDATVSTVVDRQFVENMPLNGRSFQNLIMLAPGVVVTPSTYANQGQFSVNGQRTDSNYFSVDGVSANVGITAGNGLPQAAGGSLPAFSALGGTNSLVSVDAMQEFRIQTSTFAPEFGRSPGAQISIVTRSGTNDFHGTLFDYFRNNGLDASDWFSNRNGLQKPEERQNDFGGVIGGPIIKDRTFFFFSYEGLRLRQPISAETIVPDAESRQQAPVAIQPYLNAFAIPNGADLGTGLAEFNASYSNPSSLDAYSIRIDHVINSKSTLFGRYNYSPSDVTDREPTGLSSLESTSLLTQTFTVGWTNIISQRVSNELRANYSNVRGATSEKLDTFGGAVPLTDGVMFPTGFSSANGAFFLGILGAGTASSGFGSLLAGKSAVNEQRQINVVDNVSVSIGAHQLKFGVDYRWLAPIAGSPAYEQSLIFTGVSGGSGTAESGAPLEASIQAFQSDVVLLSQNISFYGQDTWKITPRLTLTYGIRWDIDPPVRGKNSNSQPFAVTNLNDPANLSLAPRGTRLYNITYGNVAPRLGLAYQLTQKKGWDTVLRGGIGIFYDFSPAGALGNSTFGFPFSASNTFFFVPLPLTPQQAAPPVISSSLPATTTLYVAQPGVELPRTYEWNIAVEQSMGDNQSLSLTYVGALGRSLLRPYDLFEPNANFEEVSVITNSGSSNYQALQLKFQRRLSRGLQALASYTFSHSIDNASTDSAFFTPSLVDNSSIDRGDSDFDVRHAFTGALTYNLPAPFKSRLVRAVLGHWSVDDFLTARSALPVDLIGANFFVNGTSFNARPDVIDGVPLYLYGSQCLAAAPLGLGQTCPGGKGFNPAAFAVPTSGQQGTLGRNVLRGFGAWQDDFTIRRQFHITERLGLQFRGEFFNIFNHPNFGPPTATLTSPLFGLSTQTLASSLSSGGAGVGFNPLYQIGGPRSIQFALKMEF